MAVALLAQVRAELLWCHLSSPVRGARISVFVTGCQMNVLDLFSGIGGFSLGLERAGMRTVTFCEIDPYCRAVLRKHWPGVPIWDDVRTITAKTVADTLKDSSTHAGGSAFVPGKLLDEIGRQETSNGSGTSGTGTGIDVICGGFPCQDISVAGKGAGIDGERSGLWSEYARIISEVRPRYVIVENVAALLGRGLERVLGDLAALGFDAEWHCIPASAVGAPHRRDRVWIIAYAGCAGSQGTGDVCDPTLDARAGQSLLLDEGIRGQWIAEPDVGRVAHGIPARVDRLRALGNAVVPQIPEIIGRAIMSLESSSLAV
jgi:DNA (cytosine-5)-methyltransferase 1